jgi:predicted enzyme involved in methoxymalonyl-ACP biosynthesis
MSCRVLGRGVEKAFLGAICDQARLGGAAHVRGEFVRSAKNSQTENFFETCGFTAARRTADFGEWQLDLSILNPLVPKWITLQPPKPEN